MPRERELDPTASPLAFFGSEVRRWRKRLDMSQPKLSAQTSYSTSMITKVERAERPPSLEFAQECDQVFNLDGHFDRLYQFMLQTRGPIWFVRWREEIEPRAVVLRAWNPLLVPGLLQTEAYARHIFSKEPQISPEEIEDRLQARMRRKLIFDRDDPPAIWALIDEGVLHRPLGGPEVMRQQLDYLLEIVKHPSITIQIVPYSAESTVGLTGSFMLAELPQGEPPAAYVENSTAGDVTTDHSLVASIWNRYETIRADAYPQHLSLKMIEDASQQWITKT